MFLKKDRKKEDEIINYGIIPTSDLYVSGTAYKVASDRSGFNRYYMYGYFEWKNKPVFTLTDTMTIGFPAHAGFLIPMSSTPQQHQSRLSVDYYGNGNWTHYTKYNAYDWENNAGVAATYDIRGTYANTKNKGFISQYVYIANTKHDTINVSFEYGHKRLGGAPSVSVYPSGLGIAIQSYTDTLKHGIELSY